MGERIVDDIAEQILTRIALPMGLVPLEDKYIVRDAPKPFVPPPIRPAEADADASSVGSGSKAVDVILIDARAAVGKTTFARWLASKTQAPLLDLATTPVGADTARGILPNLSNGDEKIYGPEAFENGQITLIIDAVDEGRLRSGERNVEAFLFDLWAMLKSRTVRDRPGVVFLGRPESISFVELAMKVAYGDDFAEYETYRLHFFDEKSARDMVRAYYVIALEEAIRRGEKRQQDLALAAAGDGGSPVEELLNSYFVAVADALRMDSPEDLWLNEQGRQFAGYSPVLRTLGTIVGRETNYSRLAAQLHSGRNSAWAVIEEVCQTVFEREQEKLRSSLREHFPNAAVHGDAYDRKEQIRAIMAYLARKDVRNVLAEIPFVDPAMRAKYREFVHVNVADHPFCDGTDSSTKPAFSNPIFGAILLAEAMIQDVEFDPSQSVFKGCGMQSFLWQALKHRSKDENDEHVIHLVSGRFFGLIADSFDAHETMMARARKSGDSDASATAHEDLAVGSLRLRESDLGLSVGEAVTVSFTEPGRAEKDFLELYGTPHIGPEIRSVEIDLPCGEVVIEGTPEHREVRFFGRVKVRARALRFVNCTSVVGDSSASVEVAADETQQEHLDLHNFVLSGPPTPARPDGNHDEAPTTARLYTFRAMADQYPWSGFSGAAQGRGEDTVDPVRQALGLLLDVGPQIRVSTHRLTPRDKRQERTLRPLGDKLPDILRVLLDSGFVSTAANRQSSGPAFIAIRSAAGIPRLIDAMDAEEPAALEVAERLRSILTA